MHDFVFLIWAKTFEICVFFLQLVMFFEIFRKVNFKLRNVSSSVIIWLLSLKNESLAFIRTYITIKTKKRFQNLSENKKIDANDYFVFLAIFEDFPLYL